MIEDDFYATIKLKSGEEIFCKVAPSEEEDRLLLLLSNPVMITEIKGRTGTVGYKLEPWLRTTKDDMFLIDMDNVITMSESSDMEMISMHKTYAKRAASRDGSSKYKLNRKLGYISNINDAKDILENLYKGN
tara:strand:- start:51 stop:446 length:396 start_codon:yes stop_codon:yes gene_type:complete